MKKEIIDHIQGGLIVSCQARPGNPLKGADHMAAMAEAAEMGGAVGIRANAEDIIEIRKRVSLPIIGIYKTERQLVYPYITPDFEHAKKVAEYGADIIAIDATNRPRKEGTDVKELIRQIHEELDLLVMADISTFEEGVAAAEAEVDLVSTTLSGYTTYSPYTETPDLELVKRLKSAISVPVIAEGRYNDPEALASAWKAGAHAVVIGSAITNVAFITERFIKQAQNFMN